jgi:Domain of unknown function (DUF4124)
MQKLVYFLFPFVFVSLAYGATIYKWVDKKGAVHFTDDYNTIPDQYRSRVGTEEEEDLQKTKTPAVSSTSPGKNEGVKVDMDGMGEGYWKAKVQPWKNQLNEAKANYESINRQINQRIEEQSTKLLSPTQWNIQRAETKPLVEERSKYEAQMKEANEMLEKIKKEAEEAKADPEWMK